jgi:endoglucanase
MTNKFPNAGEHLSASRLICHSSFIIRHWPTLLAILLGWLPHAPAKAKISQPANPPEMKRLTDKNSPAYQAAKLFRHGVNLGNYLEAPPGQSWGVTVTADEFVAMRREGFDHVRVPVGWHHYDGPEPEFRLKPEIFGKVDFCVTNALAAGLAVLINIHHFNEMDQGPTNATPEFIALWRQIAEHYKDFPPTLAFELVNEPHDQATTALMNPIYAQAIAEIRRTNPRRTIFVEPGGWGSIDELKNLVLPPDDNILVSVHCYEPFLFTHQGASWATGVNTRQTGIVFPGPPAKPLVLATDFKPESWVVHWIQQYNTLPAEKNPSSPTAFVDKLDQARAWSEDYGRPVHIGEFGAYTKADERSRANFCRAFRRATEARGIGWCLWDWSAGFRYWDKQQNAPMPGMRAALFDKKN